MTNISKNLTPNSNIDIVVDSLDNLYNIGNGFKEGRGHSLSLSMHKPRSLSISSSKCSEEYHICVKRESNRMNEDEPVTFIGNIKVEYVSQRGQKDQVSKVTDITNKMLQQHVSSKNPASSLTTGTTMFNIQLNYDINQALDLEEWNGNFHATLLYGAMEHLASDIKNIKDSLRRMGKYIRGKVIDNTNPNNIKNLESVDNVVWKFLSSIYNSYWDGLYVDNSNTTTFRSKVSSKFTPQVPKTSNNNKGKGVVKPTFISPIFPPIPAKSQKELSKYFKKNTNTQQKKSYAHATSLSKQSNSSALKNITRETLNIKETFPNLPNKKIEEMQKVINSLKDKSKPKINMTTKDSSRKQVIVPMNTDLTKKFIKDSSLHVINIKCALKAIKSSTIVDFICVEDKGIIIMTNNVSLGSDLKEIEKYVKNSLISDAD